MSIKESKIKHLIREYLLDEGILRNKIPPAEKKLEFGFQFSFPPGQRGHMMVVFKPKEKDIIIVSLGTQISPLHVNALNSLKDNKKLQFFMDLRKYFLVKDVLYRIDIPNYRYEILDQYFLDKDGVISKNTFFDLVKKVFNCGVYSNIILGEYCAGKIKLEDFEKAKEFSSQSDFSLYS